MSDYPMLISNKLHSFRNFNLQIYNNFCNYENCCIFVPAHERCCILSYLWINSHYISVLSSKIS